MRSSALPDFGFNSRRTRLEDPIRGDIELCGTGHRERPNHTPLLPTPTLHYHHHRPHPAPLCHRKPIKSHPDKADGQQHLPPFQREIISWVSDLICGFIYIFLICCNSGPECGWADPKYLRRLTGILILLAKIGHMIMLVLHCAHHILVYVKPSDH